MAKEKEFLISFISSKFLRVRNVTEQYKIFRQLQRLLETHNSLIEFVLFSCRRISKTAWACDKLSFSQMFFDVSA